MKIFITYKVCKVCNKMSIPKGTLFDTHKVRFNVVKSALREVECKQTDSDNSARIIWWDGYMKRDELLNMYPHQRINRIPGMDQICYKSNTFNAMNKLRKIDKNLFNFFPLTFVLPNDFDQFKSEAELMLKKSEELKVDNPTWIFKPRNGQCGIGIQLFQDPSIIDPQKYSGVIQSYISPHLYNGIKFDLRLYVFVSTIKPYTVYLYREGLSRFCTEQYVKPSAENLNDLYMHLTNTSVNIKNQKADKSSYLNFATPVLNKLNKPDLWKKIKKVAALSMVAQYHQIIDQIEYEEKILAESNTHFRIAMNPPAKDENAGSGSDENKEPLDLPPIDKLHRYFHLAGIDILIDDKYEPILLEMNDRPSMFVSFEDIERDLKKNLVKEALSLISLDGSPVNKESGKWEQILPIPDDEEFNKKTLELMNKSLIKPISNFNAIKLPPPPPPQKKPEKRPQTEQPINVKVKKSVQPIQTNQSAQSNSNPSQTVKKHPQTEQSTFSQSSKKVVQNDKTVIYQLPPTEPANFSQSTKNVTNVEKKPTPQVPKKTVQTEKVVKDQKPIKSRQQETNNYPQAIYTSTKTNVQPKQRAMSPEKIRNVDEIRHSQPKKRKQSASSPEKASIRASYSKPASKDIKSSSSATTQIESSTIRKTQEHINVSPDASPISKITKNPTYPSRKIKASLPQKASTQKIDHLSSASSNNTLPPLEQNKESNRGDKNIGKATLSSLPVINQMNCQ